MSFIHTRLLDFVSIAIIGRLTGSLVDGHLDNLVPGIKVFGEINLNSPYGLLVVCSNIWMHHCFVFFCVSCRRTAVQCIDLSQRIFEGIVDRPYGFLANVSKLFDLHDT